MNSEIVNITTDPGTTLKLITYQEVLLSLGNQITDRFLYIGLIILAFSLWFIFDGHKRKDELSIELTGALSYLSLTAGLVSIIFWVISKGWIRL